jgi:UDP-glucose 4-epimerase
MRYESVLNGKTIAITGASGYIASSLVKKIIENYKCNIILVSRRDLPRLPNVEIYTADINNQNTWETIINKSDIVYHLAANTSLYFAEDNPIQSLTSSVLPICFLIEAAKNKKNKPLIIYSSTATIYGLTPRVAISEKYQPVPITIYDTHKLLGEKHLDLAAKKGYLNYISLRLSNVYGPSLNTSSSHDRGVLNKVIMRAMQGKDLEIYGNGNFLRDYVYIDDVVDALVLSGESENISGEVFNVSSGKSLTLNEVFYLAVEKVAIKTGRTVAIKHVQQPINLNEIEFRDYIANIDHIYEKLKWRPLTNVNIGIQNLIDSISVIV